MNLFGLFKPKVNRFALLPRNAKTFCEDCGTRNKVLYRPEGYDKKTGKEKFSTLDMCPNSKCYRSWACSDRHRNEFEEYYIYRDLEHPKNNSNATGAQRQ